MDATNRVTRRTISSMTDHRARQWHDAACHKSPGSERPAARQPQVVRRNDSYDDRVRSRPDHGRSAGTSQRENEISEPNRFPELVSALYEEAPPSDSARAIARSSLVRPWTVGAGGRLPCGASGHLFYRLRRDAATIMPTYVSRITVGQVPRKLTSYESQQCSPDVYFISGAND